MIKLRPHSQKCLAYVGMLQVNITNWHMVNLESLMERLEEWGKDLPGRTTAHYLADATDIKDVQVGNIMRSKVASVAVLRRLSNIFIVRVYAHKVLRPNETVPEIAYQIVGPPTQVMLAKKVYTYLGNIHEKAWKKAELVDRLKQPLSSWLLDKALPILDAYPSYRPRNRSNPHSPAKSSRGFNTHEQKVYVYLLNRYRFVFDKKYQNPYQLLIETRYLKRPNFKPLSDYPTVKGYAKKDKIKYNRLIWPGELTANVENSKKNAKRAS